MRSAHTQVDGDVPARAGLSVKVQLSLVILLIVACVSNILLAQKVKRLNSALATVRNEGVLAEGVTAPEIKAVTMSGEPITIQLRQAGLPTVLYVLSPSCGWCDKNEENVKALVAASSNKFRVVGLSLSRDGLDAYLQKSQLPFPVYTDLEFAATSAYKLGGTPETIVVSPEGRVLKVWRGAYMGQVLNEVQAYFHVSLPGIRASA